MKGLWIITVVFIISLVLCVAMLIRTAVAASTPVWVMKDCFTLTDVTAFLNTLPPASAADAKVIAINSQRSLLGIASTPYYVWYRKP